MKEISLEFVGQSGPIYERLKAKLEVTNEEVFQLALAALDVICDDETFLYDSISREAIEYPEAHGLKRFGCENIIEIHRKIKKEKGE
ncbi:hypothetical protein COB55_04215 [Candidatus Wolfebacteria bacterium]|nr:MAG: hypothetical protein COB55_04215 [Candidatus Wolfebacteria bacterium]